MGKLVSDDDCGVVTYTGPEQILIPPSRVGAELEYIAWQIV